MKLYMFAAAFAVAGIASVGTADAEDLVFTLKNGTNSVMTRFHTSPVNVGEWEEDVLGRDVLEPGESVRVTIADGRDVCKYDMKFEFDEDSDLDTTTDMQDLCELGEYTITE